MKESVSHNIWIVAALAICVAVPKKRPTGELLWYYNQFLHSLLNWVPTAIFDPARVGGCPVPPIS